MTEQQLISMGFTKISLNRDYWYELRIKKHRFITNDTIYNKHSDDWFIGYQKDLDDDVFWFNERLTGEAEFKIIFHILTSIQFKLAHQRKLIKQQ